MLLIAHRGNINGPIEKLENTTKYINEALTKGYDVELDVWLINNEFYLGHDKPGEKILEIYLENKNLWCHAKNKEAYYKMLINENINCFWHENDKFALTSKKYIWTCEKKNLNKKCICVMPEWNNFIFDKKCLGICSDYVSLYS